MQKYYVAQYGDFIEESPLWGKDSKPVMYDYGIIEVEAETGEEAYIKAVDSLFDLVDEAFAAPEDDRFKDVVAIMKEHGTTVDNEYYPTQGSWVEATPEGLAELIERSSLGEPVNWVKTIFPGWKSAEGFTA